MPTRAARTCPNCRRVLRAPGACPTCKARDEQRAPAASDYGGDWPARRALFLSLHPWCVLCGKRAKVADHYPISRRELVAHHALDPDADEHLRPLCIPCHRRETNRHQPGGINDVGET